MTKTDATENDAGTTRQLISEKLLAPFPPEVIEVKPGGGNKKYIGHEVIRQRIIDATDNQFDWTISSIEYREDGVLVRTNRETGEITHPSVMVVTGELAIPGLGKRSGQGVQALERGAGEDTYKAAESDAFKRAAMAFGCGLQLYTNAPAQQAPQRTQTRSAPREAAPVTMTDDQFAVKVREAIASKDGALFRDLADEAGTVVSRWRSMIKASDNEPTLDWVVRQIERHNISDDNLSMEAHAQRDLLREGALVGPKA